MERLAIDAGYHVLRTLGPSLRGQMAAMRGARLMGAAMTNLAFTRAPHREVRFAGRERG